MRRFFSANPWGAVGGIAAAAGAIVLLCANGATQPGRSTLRPAAGATPAPTVANPHGDIRIACETCHSADSWTEMRKPTLFDHKTTGFPLVGKHTGVACKECHKSPVFSRVAASCVDCHRDVHEGRNGLRCQDCHAPVRWVDRSDAVRRHASTSFPLRGVHAWLECTRCHGGGGEAHLASVSSQCVACHSAQYAATTSPDHAAAGYSTQCQDCHDAARTSWAGAGFNHASTGFPLDGAHRALACNTCHSGGTYVGLSAECVSCHRAEYDRTQAPQHAAAGFPTTCTNCHNTASWAGAVFDHARTRFPLTGAHAGASCTACHSGGQYAGTPTDCYACHRANYEGTTNPGHVAAGFNTACASCHSTTAWQPATFDHDRFFRIYSGRHRSEWTSCTQCHQNSSSYTDFTCLQCHGQADTDPHHREVSGYRYESIACYTCHRNV
jgi:hypothetical protein